MNDEVNDGSMRLIRDLDGSVELVFGLNPKMRTLYRASPAFMKAVDEIVECFALAAELPDEEYAQFLEWVKAHVQEDIP